MKDLLGNSNEKNMVKKLVYEDSRDLKKIILAYEFYRQPIIIDPDNQALNWLEKLCPNRSIKYIKKSYSTANKIVENCMKLGEILVIIID
jgi:hypothetical protein